MWTDKGLHFHLKEETSLYRLQDFERFNVVKWKRAVTVIAREESSVHDRGKKWKREDGSLTDTKNVNLVRLPGRQKEGV